MVLSPVTDTKLRDFPPLSRVVRGEGWLPPLHTKGSNKISVVESFWVGSGSRKLKGEVSTPIAYKYPFKIILRHD